MRTKTADYGAARHEDHQNEYKPEEAHFMRPDELLEHAADPESEPATREEDVARWSDGEGPWLRTWARDIDPGLNFTGKEELAAEHLRSLRFASDAAASDRQEVNDFHNDLENPGEDWQDMERIKDGLQAAHGEDWQERVDTVTHGAATLQDLGVHLMAKGFREDKAELVSAGRDLVEDTRRQFMDYVNHPEEPNDLTRFAERDQRAAEMDLSTDLRRRNIRETLEHFDVTDREPKDEATRFLLQHSGLQMGLAIRQRADAAADSISDARLHQAVSGFIGRNTREEVYNLGRKLSEDDAHQKAIAYGTMTHVERFAERAANHEEAITADTHAQQEQLNHQLDRGQENDVRHDLEKRLARWQEANASYPAPIHDELEKLAGETLQALDRYEHPSQPMQEADGTVIRYAELSDLQTQHYMLSAMERTAQEMAPRQRPPTRWELSRKR